MRISDTILDIITALRTAIELDDTKHTTSMTRELSRLPEFEGSTATAGYHVSPEGDITDDHWWLIMDDGSVFDADADEPTRCSKKDSRHGRYFPYTGETGIPAAVLQAADHLRASSRVAKNKSFIDMVGEASGGMAPSSAARQAPESLPDAMTMDGQEGMVVDEFDDETKPEDLQMDWQDLTDEDLKEVDHPGYMPGGEGSGTDDYDPTYDERSVHTNAGWPSP